MKNFFRKIQEFFIHLFGGVTLRYVRETISDIETRYSNQYNELCDKYQISQKELSEIREELEKYKKEHTIFSVQYKDTPKTVEYVQVCSKDRLPDEDELDKIMNEHLIDLMAKSSEFKQCIKIVKTYNPENDTASLKFLLTGSVLPLSYPEIPSLPN